MTKAERTRDTLTRAAMELFAERGYESTTAAAIADRAGVTEMTFFRHFPSKSAVLLSDPYDPMIAQAIIQQPPGIAPIPAAIGAIADGWHAVAPVASGAVRDRLRIVSNTPSLRADMVRSNAATEASIAGALIGRGASPAEARIAAAATMAALSAALLDWADGDEPELGSAIDAARRVLTGGQE